MDEFDNNNDEHCDVAWAKARRGVWGWCHAFEDTLYWTPDMMVDSAVSTNPSDPKMAARVMNVSKAPLGTNALRTTSVMGTAVTSPG